MCGKLATTSCRCVCIVWLIKEVGNNEMREIPLRNSRSSSTRKEPKLVTTLSLRRTFLSSATVCALMRSLCVIFIYELVRLRPEIGRFENTSVHCVWSSARCGLHSWMILNHQDGFWFFLPKIGTDIPKNALIMEAKCRPLLFQSNIDTKFVHQSARGLVVQRVHSHTDLTLCDSYKWRLVQTRNAFDEIGRRRNQVGLFANFSAKALLWAFSGKSSIYCSLFIRQCILCNQSLIGMPLSWS